MCPTAWKEVHLLARPAQMKAHLARPAEMQAESLARLAEMQAQLLARFAQVAMPAHSLRLHSWPRMQDSRAKKAISSLQL
jgi:hypothetical protein